MPVLHTGWNIHHIAWMQFLGFLAPRLVPAPAAEADQHLSAAVGSMVDVPVVPAARFKCDVEHRHLLGGQRRQVALAGEILGKGIVLFPRGKTDSLPGMPSSLPYASRISGNVLHAFGQPQ